MGELNVGMGMGMGDHKFKNAMAGSLRNLCVSDLVMLDIRWRAPRPDKGGFESRTWLCLMSVGERWTWLCLMSIGERLNLIREEFMVVPQPNKGGLQGHGYEYKYKNAMAGSLRNL